MFEQFSYWLMILRCISTLIPNGSGDNDEIVAEWMKERSKFSKVYEWKLWSNI